MFRFKIKQQTHIGYTLIKNIYINAKVKQNVKNKNNSKNDNFLLSLTKSWFWVSSHPLFSFLNYHICVQFYGETKINYVIEKNSFKNLLLSIYNIYITKPKNVFSTFVFFDMEKEYLHFCFN